MFVRHFGTEVDLAHCVGFTGINKPRMSLINGFISGLACSDELFDVDTDYHPLEHVIINDRIRLKTLQDDRTTDSIQ